MCMPMAPSPTKPTRMCTASLRSVQAAGATIEREGGARNPAPPRRRGGSVGGGERRVDLGLRNGLWLRVQRRLGIESRHAAAQILHVLAHLLAVGIGLGVGKIVPFAALLALVDAPRLDGLHVMVAGVLALRLLLRGLLLAHGAGIVLRGQVLRDGLVLARQALLLGAGGSDLVGMELVGLDDRRARYPLIAVVWLALLVHPAIDVRPGHAERPEENQAGDDG